MKEKGFKLTVVLLSLVVLFAYCGEESSPTTPEGQGAISVSIQEDPVVFTWNAATEKWETVFTFVIRESGGVKVNISSIRTEAVRDGDIVHAFQYRFYGEYNIPASGSNTWVWDYDDFDVPEQDTFDTLHVIVFAADANANNITLREDFTNLSFVQ